MFTSKLKVEECSSSTSNSVSNLLILRNQNHRGYKGHQHICFGLKSEQDDDDAQFDTSDSDNNQGVLMAEKHYPSVQEFASAIPNHLLLGSLLEHLCRIYGGDPTLSNMLFKAIGQRLVSMKLLSPLAISDDFSSVRLQHNQAFTELLHAASTSLFPQGQHILNTDTQGLPARPIEGLFQWQTSRYVSEFEEISRLGKGAYGKVFKVVHKLDGQCHAVKKILIKNVSKEDCKKVLREVKMLSDLQHDSIVGYRTAWMEHVQPTACSHSLLPALESPSTQYSADESLDRSSTGSSILFQSGSRSEPAAAISSMVPPGETCTVQALLPSPEKGQVVCPKLMQHIPENYVPCVFLGQQGSVKNTPCPALSWDSSALAEEGSGREELEPNNKRPCADVASQQQWADTQVATPSKEVQFHLMLYIQMQLCERSLKDWLWERNARSAEEPSSKCPYACVDAEHTLGLLRKTLEGVEYIHSMGIMHRDLKPRNIFLCGQDCQVRIGDFGLACKDITMNDHETLPSTFSNNDCAHTKGVGTFVYAAPEQLEGSHYDSKSDMYSIGVLILELFQPFGTEMERVQVLVNLREGKVPDSFCHRWPILAKYVTQLTSKDPDVRPSSTQLLRSELFNSKDMVIHGLQQRVEEQEEEIIQLRRRISQLQSSQNLAHISDVT